MTSPSAARGPAAVTQPGTPSVARYFYDCEFIEDGRTIDLISIGVVAEDGREFYAVSTDFDPSRAGRWVSRHVLPKLPSPADKAWRPTATIRDDLVAFLREPGLPIQLWAWCAAYDHVAIGQLWGAMPDLPRDMPRYTYEIRQHWEMAGSPPLPSNGADRHDALADARLARNRWLIAQRILLAGAPTPAL